MRIGSSLVLIAIGAILKFAVTTSVSGISLSTVWASSSWWWGSPAWSSRSFWPAPPGARTLCITRQAGTTWIRRGVTTHASEGRLAVLPLTGMERVRVGDPAAPYLRRYRRVRGHMAAARHPAGGDAAPEETNDARLSDCLLYTSDAADEED